MKTIDDQTPSEVEEWVEKQAQEAQRALVQFLSGLDASREGPDRGEEAFRATIVVVTSALLQIQAAAHQAGQREDAKMLIASISKLAGELVGGWVFRWYVGQGYLPPILEFDIVAKDEGSAAN